MGLGYAEGCNHDYVQHGTTTLFAALDIALERCSGCAGSGTATTWFPGWFPRRPPRARLAGWMP